MAPHLLALVCSGLTLGTLMAFTFNNWLFAWMGMEISVISMIPLLSHQNQPRMLETSVKYFVNQAAGTAGLIAGTLMNAFSCGTWDPFLFSSHATFIIIVSLALKLGIVPLHTWFVEAMQGSSLYTGMVLSTVQKLAPLALLIQMNGQTPFLIILSVSSIMVAALAAMNQTQLRKILAYSSIGHMGWLIAVIHLDPALAALALCLYIILTVATMTALVHLPTKTLSAMAMLGAKNSTVKYVLALLLLSFAGLPPLAGFMPKWLIVQALATGTFKWHLALMLLGSLFALFFYLRLMYALLGTTPPSNILNNAAWHPIYPPYKPVSFLCILGCFTLPMAPAIIALLNYLFSR